MESANELKNTDRQQTLNAWLAHCGIDASAATLTAMPGDASFRRYFRLHTGNDSFVVMDAPPSKEPCGPFIAIAKALRVLNLHVPDIIAADVDKGLLLLTDFGDATYLKNLCDDNADALYEYALMALTILQGCQQVPNHYVPPFTIDFMLEEWAWHKEWFLEKLLGLSSPVELDKCYTRLVVQAVAQPQVFMHRDFHSANLMVLPDAVGILDFQDAFIGPVTYDAVSLLRDCYIAWPEAKVQHWALSYAHRLRELNVLDVSDEIFMYWFDLMGMQRHLKALLTFARKSVRDGQHHYLQHIPRTLNYLLQVSARYPDFEILNDYYRHSVQPAFDKMSASCAR